MKNLKPDIELRSTRYMTRLAAAASTPAITTRPIADGRAGSGGPGITVKRDCGCLHGWSPTPGGTFECTPVDRGVFSPTQEKAPLTRRELQEFRYAKRAEDWTFGTISMKNLVLDSRLRRAEMTNTRKWVTGPTGINPTPGLTTSPTCPFVGRSAS